MTRFQRELNGSLGAYWQNEAKKSLEKIKADLDAGKITIDENGVARNCIGRVLMDDLLEQLALVTGLVDTEATQTARAKEVEESLAAYRKRAHTPDFGELRAAFGTGTTVVDVITGEKIYL